MWELRFVKEELRKWDEDFFIKNDRLLNNNDYMGDDDFKELSKKKKVVLKFFELWNIIIYVF